MASIDPTAGPLDLYRWVDGLHWAIAMHPREGIAAQADWMESEFERRLGAHSALTYVRRPEAFLAFQIAEMLPRFTVLPAETVAAAISGNAPPAFMAEESYGHANANYFGFPLSVAYPGWLGTWADSAIAVVLFVRDAPYEYAPLLDARHRDIWGSWIGAWYSGEGGWSRLVPARTGAFIAWYVERLNRLLERLVDLDTTASALTGEVQPLKQISMIRSVFQLVALVTKMMTSSDPYTRTTWALQALARFDDLGWGFDLIVDDARMTTLMAPLERDIEVGACTGPTGDSSGAA